jgi:hypothetical protein
MNGVVGYLTENCCAGSGQCAPLCKPVRVTTTRRAASA